MWENVSSIHPFICAYTLHSSLPALCLSLWKKNQSFNLELHVRRYHTHYYRLFSQKLSCVGDLDCFTGQFTSPDCSMTYSIRPHIWRSDGKQIVIFALQTFLGGKSFVWNQDVFQWKEPRKRNLIFGTLFFSWVCETVACRGSTLGPPHGRTCLEHLPGRCPGGIWVRCLDHLNWLLSVWRSSGSTQILFQVTELFILSPRNRPATLWRKSLISTTCICNVLLSARACDNRWR